MGRVTNVVAWAVLIGLAGVALLVVNRLGFAGLALFGLLTLFVCTQLTLDADVPTWGEHVFRERLAPGAQWAPRPDLRFFRWCGIVLTAIGAAGFVWQAF